jgi:DNA-binding MarR family transcriptional regulator
VPELPSNTTPFLPQLIAQAFGRVMSDLHEHLVSSGYRELRPTHCLNVFRFMDCDGTRPATLARRAGMTPQAMGELVSYLERHDYVRRVPDPTDGRGRVVVYADRGTQAAEVATRFFADLESRWGALLGLGSVEDVKAALALVVSDTSSGSSPGSLSGAPGGTGLSYARRP